MKTELPSRDAPPVYSGTAQVWVSAPPEQVYDLVSDLKRMGEFSPECYRVEWIDGATAPAVGARARGWNRYRVFRWSRDVQVLVAERGCEFTFQTVPKAPLYIDSTVWSYRFEPKDGGTLVTESYAIVKISPWIHAFEIMTGRPDKAPAGMQQTLERIKAAVEGGSR